ncbi:predicted protein [Postia placenta Mad-698-R]|uniref:cAMP-independent regulatory protein pac2 n=2 Tax=Rhodonia placenta TaxID=104341 RepID=A0A1X6N9M3_9APHY|nr:hypothetical protein POSPLADRAFT_1044734 [Postia placenta MAD-698-R-SB12]EED79312.1 predicted protein [Postia placenta Mad-698-R]KAF9813124.1 hypothetical protein IEO21_05735 [Postia placenta]OSX65348.1 hypothetical protein POSPLADRAFT_1044734 [Postia placenta MAD-698-R-SB12]
MFYEPVHDVQKPTHPRLHLRDMRDAHIIFEAVRRGLMKPVNRRLNEVERTRYITSGSVFVWEESEEETGLKRWTDGRIWSQSRMREPYLFYDEKLSGDDTANASGQTSQSTYRFVEGPSRTWSSSAQSHFDRSDHHPTGLVKQAYSAWVLPAPNARPRKWHLTAYFTYADLPNIPTVDRDPTLCSLSVPLGVYRSGKTRTRNPDTALGVSPPPPSQASAGPSGSAIRSGSGDRMLAPPQSDRNPRPAAPRAAEDERMIQMLNSRPI